MYLSLLPKSYCDFSFFAFGLLKYLNHLEIFHILFMSAIWIKCQIYRLNISVNGLDRLSKRAIKNCSSFATGLVVQSKICFIKFSPRDVVQCKLQESLLVYVSTE